MYYKEKIEYHIVDFTESKRAVMWVFVKIAYKLLLGRCISQESKECDRKYLRVIFKTWKDVPMYGLEAKIAKGKFYMRLKNR